jgi:hypothetical protein
VAHFLADRIIDMVLLETRNQELGTSL